MYVLYVYMYDVVANLMVAKNVSLLRRVSTTERPMFVMYYRLCLIISKQHLTKYTVTRNFRVTMICNFSFCAKSGALR